jgi:carboxyl-terminal processing protease
MDETSYKKLGNAIVATLVGILIFTGGYFSGVHSSYINKVSDLTDKTNQSVDSADFAIFWKAWSTLQDKYVPTTSTSTPTSKEKVYGAIQGLTASYGDPYTVFFPPVEAKSFNEQISGSFEGVGMELDIKDGLLTVVAPLKNTPAYRAGIKSGDIIGMIDKTITQSISLEEAIKKIKGPKGTPVKFTVVRKGEKNPLEITVIRDVISIPSIDTEIKDGVFIIHLYNFSENSANAFRGALREFIESGKNKLILDLRGNPGGYLEAAVDMASWFLPSGTVIVREESKNTSENQEFRSRGYNIFNNQLKFAILIDQGSASASEILAGALSENGKAILVGKKSYGKGSVQELVNIDDKTSLKVTIAKWLTPNGISISKEGIKPTIDVDLDPTEFKKGNDTQLKRAIEELNK